MANQDFYGSGAPNYGGAPAYGGTPQHDQYAQQPPAQQYGGNHSPYPQQQSPYPPQGHEQGYGAPPAQQAAGPYGQVTQTGYPPQQQGAYDDRSGHSPYPQHPYGAPAGQYAEPPVGGAYGQAPPVIGPDGQPIPDGPDGERGLGRMALGAAGGGLLGHQLGGHGGLGAIGGAIAAQMLGGGDKYVLFSFPPILIYILMME
jgi:hypothetical protein